MNNNKGKIKEIVLENNKEDEILEVKDIIFNINQKIPDYILNNNTLFYKTKYYSQTELDLQLHEIYTGSIYNFQLYPTNIISI